MKTSIVPAEIIEHRIFLIRGLKVMLDFHLAELYGVETKALKRAVKRNRDRFPEDFCFELSSDDAENLRYHFGTSSGAARHGEKGAHWGGRRYFPYAFTEQGVAMLSSVLHSKRAIQVNIAIMRAFVKLREILGTHKELAKELEELERELDTHDRQIQSIFEAIRQLMQPPEKPKRQIGFRVGEPKVVYKIKRKKLA